MNERISSLTIFIMHQHSRVQYTIAMFSVHCLPVTHTKNESGWFLCCVCCKAFWYCQK